MHVAPQLHSRNSWTTEGKSNKNNDRTDRIGRRGENCHTRLSTNFGTNSGSIQAWNN